MFPNCNVAVTTDLRESELFVSIVCMTVSQSTAPDARVQDLYLEHRTHLMRVAIAMCRNPELAEECLHDVFVAALRRELEEPGYIRDPAWPWLRKTLIHTVIARHKRERRGKDLLHFLVSRLAGPEDIERLDVLHALHDLPLRMRQSATLFYLEDLDTATIASLMQCSPRTVETQLRNARKRLQHSLGSAYSDILQEEP